jgi:hypothetical protein
VHQSDQSLADGKTQACPTELARSRVVGLHKWLEQSLSRRFGKPNTGIVYFEANEGMIICQVIETGFDRDFTAPCELHGVSNEIDQDLVQAYRVALEQRRNSRINE